jgi:hypothetical protein
LLASQEAVRPARLVLRMRPAALLTKLADFGIGFAGKHHSAAL